MGVQAWTFDSQLSRVAGAQRIPEDHSIGESWCWYHCIMELASKTRLMKWAKIAE